MDAAKHVFTLAISALAFGAAPANSTSVPDELSRRDPSIHWPSAFDPRTAPVFAHNDLLVQAGWHRVWTRLLDVQDWPNWFVLTKDVSIDGSDRAVRRGTPILLKIFGGPITSKINEYVPDSRLSWFPKGVDEAAPPHYHTWHLVPEAGGCRATTEETGVGPNDVKTPEANSRLVRRTHDLWPASLRWTSEQ